MKNLHLIPTDKPSRLHLGKSGLVLCDLVFNPMTINSQHIYITSDEEIKDRDWYISLEGKLLQFTGRNVLGDKFKAPKIILTTDQDLIKDGIQEISEDFLQWFVKNPSCERVEVEKKYSDFTVDPFVGYKIIIPQEEPKQEYKYIGECNGNNDNGCFLDSPAHDCGCFTRVVKDEPKQQEQLLNFKSE